MSAPAHLTGAEFFAGIGLVRAALEEAGVQVAWANDIEPCKQAVYEENFGGEDFLLADVRSVTGADVPTVDLATASFPCTDLSLAGNRGGIRAGGSSMFWEFARVLEEMGGRAPQVILLENVPGFATSRGGQDLCDALLRLNDLGYSCDLLAVNAAHFVPQSRLRMFIVGSRLGAGERVPTVADALRPQWIIDFIREHPAIDFHGRSLHLPDANAAGLDTVVDRFPRTSAIWWEPDRVTRFVDSLSALQLARLDALRNGRTMTWRTAYRRTRSGVAVWEMRSDAVAGCLRTARGGSSKQAVVEAGGGEVRVRWMTASEYAALQGAPNYRFSSVTENKALFGFGDAVCVPVISWITSQYLVPLFVEQAETAA
jgi:DNA (cytosine-5)-methyltransferase 1